MGRVLLVLSEPAFILFLFFIFLAKRAFAAGCDLVYLLQGFLCPCAAFEFWVDSA